MKLATLVTSLLSAALVLDAQEASYLMRGEHLPTTSVSNGHVQTVTPQAGGGVMVQVSVALEPIGSRGSFGGLRGVTSAAIPSAFVMPAALRRELRPGLDSWEAATLILAWVARHVRFDEASIDPQDALSVLKRGRGRCSGLANLSTALLVSSGFDARTVSGVLMDGRRAVPHRWLECWLPGAGWVPSDPTLGLWTITPQHVVFADAVRDLPEIVVVSSAGADLDYLPRRGSLLCRPNDGASLVCQLAEAAPAVVAVLRSAAGDERRVALEPTGRFDGLMPGTWQLSVEVDGVPVRQVDLTMQSGHTHSFVVDLPEQ